jgi:hypothetical protein
VIAPGVLSGMCAVEPRAVAEPALRLHPGGQAAALGSRGADTVVGNLGKLLEER